MKRIEEMIKIFKSKSQFGFYVSIFLIVSCLVVILLVNDLLIQILLGVIIALVLIRFIRIISERNRLNQVLRNYKNNPRKSLDAVNTQIDIIKKRMKNTTADPKQRNLRDKKAFKHEEELQRYEQLLDAIREQHPQI